MEIGRSFPSFLVFLMNSNIKLAGSLDIQTKPITSQWRGGKLQMYHVMSEFFGGFKIPIWVKTTDLSEAFGFLFTTCWIIKAYICFDCFCTSWRWRCESVHLQHKVLEERWGKMIYSMFGICSAHNWEMGRVMNHSRSVCFSLSEGFPCNMTHGMQIKLVP